MGRSIDKLGTPVLDFKASERTRVYSLVIATLSAGVDYFSAN